jgi:hypothetical protein
MNTSMICVCTALLMFAVPAHADDGAQEVIQVMHAYEDAWSHHDARLTFRGSRDAFPGNFRRRQGGRDARGATWAL